MGTRGQVSHSQACRCTREFPGGLRRTWRLPGRLAASALGVSRGKSQLAVHSGTGGTLRRWVRKGFRKWHVPKEALGLGFGTSVVLRRVPKGGLAGWPRRGHSGGLQEGSGGGL